MQIGTSLCTCLLLLLVIAILDGGFLRLGEAGKTKVHIPDELDDVEDNEEDEDWRQWGAKSKKDEFDPPPMDPNGMDPVAFEAEMMKRHVGPSLGFVKLAFRAKRSPEKVAEIAMKWTKVLKTGSIAAKFMAVDLNTLMFTVENGQDTTELIEFVLSDPEAYELKIGSQVYRRPGDPPLDDEGKPLRNENANPTEEQKHPKDEL